MNLTTLEVSSADLAGVMGITKRAVDRLRRAGVLRQTSKARYSLAGAIQSYIEYAAHGKIQSEVLDSKQRLLTAQARKAEMDADRTAGRLLDVDDVQTVLNETMAIIATQMDGLGGRLAGDLAGESDPAVIRQRLLAETRRIRATAADKLARLGAIGTDTANTTAGKRHPR